MQHHKKTVWDAKIAPRHLIYLGDGAALAFAKRSLERHGGNLVVLDVDVDERTLIADPAFVEACGRLKDIGLTAPPLLDAATSLACSGRVAIAAGARICRRRICRDASTFWTVAEGSGLVCHAQAWHDAKLWRHLATRSEGVFNSARDWRDYVGTQLLEAFFSEY